MKKSTHLGTLAAATLGLMFSLTACDEHKTVDEPVSDGGDGPGDAGDRLGDGDDGGQVCCDAAAICLDHQVTYADKAACDAAGDACHEVTICCSTAYCGEDGSALTLSAARSGDGRELSLKASGEAYYLTCTSSVRLFKEIEDGKFEALVDERPNNANGAYYIDGEFHAEVLGAYGCDAINCSALEQEAPFLSLVEYVAVGSKPAPAGAGVSGGVPDIESKPYEGPVRVEADLFPSSPCTGKPFTRSVELP